MYTRKSTDRNKSHEKYGERVVMKLIHNAQESKTLIALDNFFTTVILVTGLHNIEILSVETI